LAFKNKFGGLTYQLVKMTGAPQEGDSPKIGFGIDSRLCDNPPKPRAWQHGAMDLAANVAILAIAAGSQMYVLRPPLYVNGPTKTPPFQEQTYHNIAVNNQTAITYPGPEPSFYKKTLPIVDVFPNLAVKFQTQVAPEALDPFIAKRVAQQPDLYPNIAASAQGPVYQPPTPLDLPVTAKKAQQPDLYPNLSAQTETVPTVRTPFFMVYRSIRGPVPDLFPNIAATQVVIAYVPPAYLDVPIAKRPAPQIDVFPNIALKGVEPPKSIPSLDWTLAARKWNVPDVFPNLAVSGVAPQALIQAPIEPLIWRHAPPQIEVFTNVALMLSPAIGNVSTFQDLPAKPPYQFDLYPNIAVTAAIAPFQPPPAIDLPIFRRAPVQIELFPNVAIKFQTAVIQGTPEPTFTKRVPQIDFFPNIAALVPPAAVPIPAPLDLPIFRRYAPQIEIFPNLAVLEGPEQRPIIIPIDPWINVRYAPQVEVFQNSAIYAPLPPVVGPAPVLPTSGLLPGKPPGLVDGEEELVYPLPPDQKLKRAEDAVPIPSPFLTELAPKKAVEKFRPAVQLPLPLPIIVLPVADAHLGARELEALLLLIALSEMDDDWV
jgi:hypothetical protein